MLPVEVLVPGANSRSTCKHCGIYTGPSLLEPYKSHNNIYIYKAAYNNMMNHVIIFLVLSIHRCVSKLFTQSKLYADMVDGGVLIWPGF